MVDIIAKFNYNNKCYAFGNNNNEIEFYLKDENNFTSSLSEKEINICMQILDSITIDKKTSVYLYNKRIGQNIYQIYYDIKTRLHWWNLIYGNKDSQEDNIELNFLYNNMPDIYYLDIQENNSENSRNNNNKFVKLIRMIGPVLVTVLVCAPLSFGALKLKQRYIEYIVKREINKEIIEEFQDEKVQSVDDLQKILGVNLDDKESFGQNGYDEKTEETAELLRKEISSNQEYNWHSIEEAIYSNTNLTESEKNFLKKLKFVFDENHQYMNLDMVINNLKTLKITYSKEEGAFNWFLYESAGGGYLRELNHIYIKDANNFEEADLRIFIHELLHPIQIPSNGYWKELAVTLEQREILQRLIDDNIIEIKDEYYDSNGALTNLSVGYETDHKLLYLTLLLISPEARNQCLFQGDERTLAEELMKIDVSNNYGEKQYRAYRLVDYLDRLKEGYDESSKQQRDKLCFDELQYYYECKYGKPIEQNLDAVLAFYDDYDFTIKVEDKEYTFGENKNRQKLGEYTDDLSEYEISDAIIEAVLYEKTNDNEETENIAITAKPSNLFFDPHEPSIVYWKVDGETHSKIIDTTIQEKYAEKIADKIAEKKNGRIGRY